MFGVITFMPLYLQLVYGASATSSGLRMLPLMLGLLSASIVAGRIVSRVGRYKAFPVAGTAVLTVGLFLLSRLGPDTSSTLASVYMLVVGVGIGLVMQVLILVVQNDAPAEDMGVATSTATFFRSMGGCFGVAVFGAIFGARLHSELAALPHEVAARFAGGVQINPAQAHALPPAVREQFLGAFADSLHVVFLWGAAVAAVAFGLSWLLREVPLRRNVHAPAQLAGREGAAGGTGSEPLVDRAADELAERR
jgi:hypothetical protein